MQVGTESEKSVMTFNQEVNVVNSSSTPSTADFEINSFVNRASILADQIVTRKDHSKESIIRHHYTPWFSSIWWSTYSQPELVIPRKFDRQEAEKTAGYIGKLLAAISGNLGAFIFGSALVRYVDAEGELRQTNQFETKLASLSTGDQAKVTIAKQVANLKERICTRIRNSAAADLALRVAMAVSCGVVLAAVLASSKALVAAGTISALIAAGIMIYKQTLPTHKQNERDAQVLLKTALQMN